MFMAYDAALALQKLNIGYQRGDRIVLNAAFGEQILRIVVQDLGGVITITRREEFESAGHENRDPIAVGFKKYDVVLYDPNQIGCAHG